MKFATSSILRLFACAAFLFSVLAVQAEDKKADPTGTWTWTQAGRQGGEGREVTLKIKKDGDKLAGTMSARNNEDTKLEDVKMTGDELTFKITREVNGNSFTAKYAGKVAGDTLTGKIEMAGRDGQARSRDWAAKRKGDTK